VDKDMKTLFIIMIIITFSGSLLSQSFERQLGIKLGTTSGITGKVVKDKKSAIEGTLGFRKGGVQLYTLIEAYKPLGKNSERNWYMYFGGGAHVGYINGYNRIRRWSNTTGYYWEEERASGPVFGIDGVVGVEFNFPLIPLVMFVEFKPLVELQSFKKLRSNFWNTGIGIVYRFNNL
jgi:hypothetical protein